MSYRGNGRGGYNSQYNRNNNNNNNNFQNSNSNFGVDIVGWNGASQSDCIDFISRKTRIHVTNALVDPCSGVLRGFVKNQNQLNELLNWSGVRFAGQLLKFSKSPDAGGFGNNTSTPSGTNSAIDALRNFLKARYNPELKMLNLSLAKQDPSINAGGFFNSNSTSSKFFPALMKVAQDLKLDVVTVDLSGNDLSDLTTITTLPQTFPYLQNLSLQNNKFTRLKSFDVWKNKLNYVRELLLFGNPLVAQVTPQQVPQVKMDFMRIFPRLVVLNGEVLRNEEVLNRNLTFPFDSPKSMFFLDDEIQNMSTNFISNYLSLWDAKREDLMILYQNESQFSVQVDSSHPHLIESTTSYNSSFHTDSNTFNYYLPVSRNLSKVSSTKARLTRLGIGQEQIFKIFSQLPKTKHDLMTRPDLFSMEAYRYPQLGGILITLHGSFEETAPPDNLDALNSSLFGGGSRGRMNNNRNKKIPLSKKTFDRTFVVIPGPNGSMIVASDLLLIRPFSGSDAWNNQRIQNSGPTQVAPAPTPSPAPVAPQNQIPPVGLQPQPQPGPTANDLPPEVRANLNPIQQELLVKVLLETKLNLQYGIMLCEQSNWDYQLCIVNFKNSVATLPPDAYAP